MINENHEVKCHSNGEKKLVVTISKIENRIALSALSFDMIWIFSDIVCHPCKS